MPDKNKIKNKLKIVDEVWDEARIRGFLAYEPKDKEEADFQILYRAYKHMRVDDFSKFLTFFLAEGHDLGACNHQGQSVLDITRRNRLSQPFVQLLEQATRDGDGWCI